MTSFNSKDKQPRIQRYDALRERFGEIVEVACKDQEATELLFAHLQAFVKHMTCLPPQKHTTLKLRHHKQIIPSMRAFVNIFIVLY